MKLNQPYDGFVKGRGNSRSWGKRKINPKFAGDTIFDYTFKAGSLDMIVTAEMMFVGGIKICHIFYHEIGKRGKARWDRSKYKGQGIAIRIYSTVKRVMNYLVQNESVDGFLYVGMDETSTAVLQGIADEFNTHVEGFNLIGAVEATDRTLFLLGGPTISEEKYDNLLTYIGELL